MAGWTTSADFPGIAGGEDTVFAGSSEGFAARLSSGLTTLLQSTFLGGNSYDWANDVAIHSWTGEACVAGSTGSPDFPWVGGSSSDSTFSNGEADAGSTFAGWSGGCAGLSDSTTVEMSGDWTCTAGFDLLQPLVIFADGFESGDTDQWSLVVPPP